jgi:hypothetical protein
MKFFTVLCSSIGLAVAWTDRNEEKRSIFDQNNYASSDVIHRDVAVIGGGSTGTYGAIKLGDLGKSVVLVERASVLGGHENTYIEPTTGTPIDYGVQAYLNIPAVTDFFARFHIPISTYIFSVKTTVYADFKTGEVLPNFTTSYNFAPYKAQLDKYPDLAWSWNLPYPVPADLLLPFGDFIIKYSLQNIAYSIFSFSAGVSNVLQQLTVNVFKWLDDAYLVGIAGGDITTTDHNNGELYVKALAELGPNALLSSTVVAAYRPSQGPGVRLVVQTPTGNKLIIASQLLVTIPPLVQNMSPFDLDNLEKGLFQKFTYSGYYAGLVNNTGFPNGYRYVNAVANATYHIPNLPGIYSISPTAVDGIFSYWYGSATDLTEAQIKADTTAIVKRLSGSSLQPGFPAFSSHTPFKLVVSADDISNGYYRRLEGLQGHRNTWYTGAAFLSHNSAGLWNFTQTLLPKIVGAC